jgi:hypothetical protein
MSFVKRMAREYLLLLIIGILSGCIVYASTNPIGPESIAKIKSERMPDWNPSVVAAEAGNVTELFINATSITKHWAGFFGNITGVITLDDANNWTMYDWMDAEPQGEVYASTHAVTWSNIACLNHTSSYNVTDIEKTLGMQTNDEDGVNETFCPGCGPGAKDTTPVHPEIFVGYRRFQAGDCWALNTYVRDDAQNENFTEILLHDGTDPVYAAIIEDDKPNSKGKVRGFDNRFHDFQLMVGENGNGTNAWTTTPYYFYVELE